MWAQTALGFRIYGLLKHPSAQESVDQPRVAEAASRVPNSGLPCVRDGLAEGFGVKG